MIKLNIDAKKALLIAGVIVIVFGAFKLYEHFRYRDFITYAGDPANSCIWKNDSIVSTTLVAGFQHPTVRIKKSAEQAFIARASANSACWFKL